MRILVVNNHRDLAGGLETYLQCVMPALHGCGHQVALLYKTEAHDQTATIDSGGGCSAIWSAQSEAVLLDELASWDPDVVYLHESPSLQVHTGLIERYPVVMFAHGYYGACATGRKMHAFPQAIPCSRRCGPACLILHYPRRCGGLNPITMGRNYRTQMASQALLARHSAIVVASEHMRLEYLRHGVDAVRAHVVPLPPSGVEIDPSPPATTSSRNRMLFIGRLTDLKGVEYLFHAMRHAEKVLGRPLTLTVAGTGPEEGKLRKLAQELSLRVEFTGWLSAVERVRQLRKSDLLAVPSIWPEPFGMVGIEAGCLGIPAVAYAVGGITEWLRPGKSGEIAPGNPPTAQGLADAMVRALADQSHHQELSRGAWEVAQRFTLAAHLDKLLPILERAAQEGVFATEHPRHLPIAHNQQFSRGK